MRIFVAKTSPSPGRAASAALIPSARRSVKARADFELPRPHSLERLGPEAGVFVRLGSTNRRADPAQIDEMRRFGQFQSFDVQPIPDLNSEALDFRAASELFASVRKLAPSAFRNLRITTGQRGLAQTRNSFSGRPRNLKRRIRNSLPRLNPAQPESLSMGKGLILRPDPTSGRTICVALTSRATRK
jgi:hypothetical protein